MSRIVTLIFVFLPFLVISQVKNETGKPFIKNYTLEHFGLHPQSWDVLQDQRGVMYFANGGGIIEYDGTNWRLMEMPNKSSSRSLAMDKEGSVFVGGDGDFGYLKPDSLGQSQFFSLIDQIHDSLRQFGGVNVQANNDGVYFGTTPAIFHWHNNNMTIHKPKERYTNALMVNETYYARDSELGLMKMDGDSMVLVPGGEQMEDENVEFMLAISDWSDEKMLVGTRRKLYVYDHKSFTPFSNEASDLLNESFINDAVVLPNGNIAIATFRSGVIVINLEGQLLQVLNTKSGLQNNTVNGLHLDANGNLWMALNYGISQSEIPSPLTVLAKSANLDGTLLASIRHNGTLYIGTFLNSFYLDEKNGEPYFRKVPDLNRSCWSFLSMGKDLLVATGGDIHKIVNNHALTLFEDEEQQLRASWLYRSTQDTNRVIVGMFDGMATIYNDPNAKDGWINEGKIDGIDEGVRTIMEDAKGNYWLGTEQDGVIKLSFSSEMGRPKIKDPIIQYYSDDHGLPIGGVSVFKVSGDIYYTMKDGVFKYLEDEDRFIIDSTFMRVNFAGSAEEYNLREDSLGNVWVNFGAETAYAVKQSNGSYHFEKDAFVNLKGYFVINPESDGIVWFATDGKMIRYDGTIEKDYNSNFPVLIRSVTIGEEQSLLYGGNISISSEDYTNNSEIEYSDNAMRFEYSALSYEKPETNLYQYKLEGFDNNWSSWSTESKRDYTNLPGGDYTFRVKGKNLYGHESEEATFDFRVLKPWWLTWWAYLGYVLLGGGILYWFSQWRSRQLRERGRELEKTVEVRTKEIQEKIEELGVINNVQQGLVEKMDMNSIYELVGDQLRNLFDAQTLVIRTFDLDNETEIINYAIEKGEKLNIKNRPLDKFARHLINTKDPILIRSEFKDFIQKYSDDESLEGEVPKSAVFSSMIVDDKVIGNVSLQNVDREDAFSESDVNLLGTLTNSMSIALENARLFDRANQLLRVTEQRAEELAVINKVQEGLVKQSEIQGIFEFVGESLRDIVDAQTIVISSFDHDEEMEFFNYASRGGEPFTIRSRSFDNFTRHVIDHKKPILINENFKDYIHKFLDKNELKWTYPKSAIFIPIATSTEVIGNVSLQNLDKENAYSESDVKLLETLVNSTSIAIENTRLFEETKQQANEMSTVNSVSQALSSNLDLETLFKVIGDSLQELFAADIVYIAMINRDTNVISFPYQYGDTMAPLNYGEGLTSNIIETKKSRLMIKDVQLKNDELGIKRIGIEATSYLGVPIFSGDEVLGVLSVQSTKEIDRFSDSDTHLLETIAANVGIAIHNAQLFEDAEKARAQAEEASEAKSTFLSTVSHELRTPLTSVIGFTKIIKERLEERILPFVVSEERKTERAITQVNQNLDIVISEGERLTTLINTVLDLAKIEAGRLDWNMELLPIPAMINQATAATSALFVEKSLPLRLEIEENLPEILGDKDRLIQVVINLISNAIKFTDEGDVTIKAISNNGSIQISVKDSGIGISETDQPKVFEKFKQVGDTLTDKPKGTGLGLPICKEIVEYHGGKIWVESEIDIGSTFIFNIPIKSESVGSDSKQMTGDEKKTKRALDTQEANGLPKIKENGQKTILIADDEPEIRNLLRQKISEYGYAIREVENGKQAVDSIRKHQPDLVILDVLMPEMNGFDVAAILKSDPKTKHIPIIVLSIVDDKKRVSQLGVESYLTKPIDTKRLMKEIKRLIGKDILTSHSTSS